MANTIGKAALIDKINEATGIPKKDIATVIETELNVIADSLQKGDKVTLTGFGSFKVNKVKAHEGINPRTKEPIKIAAANRVRFTVGKPLKEIVNTKPKKKTKVDLTKKKKKTT